MASSVVSSISRLGLTEPFDLQIARGQITMHSTVNIYGYQPTVSTTFIPLWENATTYTYPGSAQTMYLTGTASDTAKILINGLDANYVAISETVTLNGTTPVPTTKQYFRINSMLVTSGNPAAEVYLKNLAGSTTYAQINAGVGRTQAAIYTVPAGYTLFLQRVDVNTSLNGNDYATYRNRTVSPTGVVQLTQQVAFPTSYNARRIMPRPFPEKTDIQLQAKIKTGSGEVSVSAEAYLIKNDGQTP